MDFGVADGDEVAQALDRFLLTNFDIGQIGLEPQVLDLHLLADFLVVVESNPQLAVGLLRLRHFLTEVADAVVTFATVPPLDHRQAHIACNQCFGTGESVMGQCRPLDSLLAKVTFHVGLGTVAPVVAEDATSDVLLAVGALDQHILTQNPVLVNGVTIDQSAAVERAKHVLEFALVTF